MPAYNEIVERIHDLSAEQHKLYVLAATRELTASQRKRLTQIKEELNGLWFKRKNLRPRFQDSLEVWMHQVR